MTMFPKTCAFYFIFGGRPGNNKLWEKFLKPFDAATAAKSELEVSMPSAGPLNRLRRASQEVRTTFREVGFKGVLRRYGWKIFALFFVYYLVRDLTLYIAIPWLIANHFTS